MKIPFPACCLPSSALLLCLVAILPTQAQIIPDATLPTPSVVTTNGTTDAIAGGTPAGSNLFHSFEQFSIPTGNTASFQHQPGIINIISRVTGLSSSRIDGLIEALETGGNPSTANLFLINPNGIIFGKNASLNIGGSFVASTASSIKFPDGREFSTTNQESTPALLSVNVPLGLQFGKPAAAITVEGATLKVAPEKTLAIVGGNVDLIGASLIAPGGRVELGSIASPGLVSLTPTATNFVLGYEGIENFQDIRFSQAKVNTNGDPSGSIQLVGRNILLQDKTILDSTTKSQNGGFISIRSEHLDVRGFSGVANISTETTGSGRGGDIAINTKKLLVQEGALIATSTSGNGLGGDMTVNATDSIEIIGTSANGNASRLATQTVLGSSGNGGNLAITTKELIIRDGGFIFSLTNGSGKGGDSIINATGSVILSKINTLTRPNGIFASALSTGKGGDITITTQRLVVQNGSQITSATRGRGDGGNLTVTALDSVTAIGTSSNGATSSGLFAQTFASGNAGRLNINTGQLSVIDGAQITSASAISSQGNAGEMLVKATNVELVGIALSADGQIIPNPNRNSPFIASGLFASTNRNSTGNGANLTVETQRLSLRDGATLQTSTLGSGKAGDLVVNATDSIEVVGTAKGGLYPTSIQSLSGGVPNSNFVGFPDATGKGGLVSIRTGNLTVRDGAQVVVSSLNPTSAAQGAGNIEINARNIRLDRGKLNAETASSDGGNITLNLRELLALRNQSRISTSAGTDQAGGNGGNIKINAPFIVSAPNNNSDITANAFSGRGGRVEIDATGIFYLVPRSREELVQLLVKPPLDPSRLPTNDITAISQQNPSLSGTVIINTPDVDPSRGLLQLPTEPENVQVAQGCQTGENQSSIAFFNTGRGGLAPSPYEPLSQSNIWEDVSPPSQKTASATPPDTIVEAQGWIINDKGEVVLVAEAPTPGFQSRCRLR